MKTPRPSIGFGPSTFTRMMMGSIPIRGISITVGFGKVVPCFAQEVPFLAIRERPPSRVSGH